MSNRRTRSRLKTVWADRSWPARCSAVSRPFCATSSGRTAGGSRRSGGRQNVERHRADHDPGAGAQRRRKGQRRGLRFGYVQAAVYNAVNGITGEYELYEWNTRGRRGFSAGRRSHRGTWRLMEYFGSGDFPTAGRSRRTWTRHSRRRSSRSRTAPPRSRAFATANERPSGSSSCGSTTAATPRSSSTARWGPASGGPRRRRCRSSAPGWDRSTR